jgi:hypothetical protein
LPKFLLSLAPYHYSSRNKRFAIQFHFYSTSVQQCTVVGAKAVINQEALHNSCAASTLAAAPPPEALPDAFCVQLFSSSNVAGLFVKSTGRLEGDVFVLKS